MRRLAGPVAGLAAYLCGGAITLAQTPGTPLPPVEITAPQPPRAQASAPQQPRRGGVRRSARTATPSPAIAQGATAITAAQPRQLAPIGAASERIATGAQVNAVPFGRPGEALEVVPA